MSAFNWPKDIFSFVAKEFIFISSSPEPLSIVELKRPKALTFELLFQPPQSQELLKVEAAAVVLISITSSPEPVFIVELVRPID